MMRALFLASTAPLFLLGVNAASAAEAKSEITIQGGFLNTDVALSDREFYSISGVTRMSGGPDLKFEIAHQRREENATYAAFGAEFDIDAGGSLGISFGGSNSDLGILPDWLAELSYERDLGAEQGILLRSRLSYAEYAGGIDETRVGGEIVKYFPAFGDGSYVIGQFGAVGTWVNSGADFGWEATASVNYVKPSGLSMGVSVSSGEMAYDTTLAAVVENSFIAIRPSISYRVSDNAEVFLRGEYIDADLYTFKGASVGVKVLFD